MPLDAVIFDVDGTIVDTNEAHARAWTQALRQYGFGLPVSRLLPEIGKGGPKLLEDVIGPEAAEAHSESLRAAHDEHYRRLLEAEGARVFPDAVALVRAVKERGLRTAIATAAEQQNLERVLEAANLDLIGRVDAVVNGSDVAESKPAPDVVRAAARKLGVVPAQCALIGDTPYDAMSSLQAGALCLGVCTGVHAAADLHRAGARASYTDPADLLAHLDEALDRAAPAAVHLTPNRMASLMDTALDEARAGLEADEMPIGSALVDGDGHVIGRGHRTVRATRNPAAQAELNAANDAVGDDLRVERGLLLITTLEPTLLGMGMAIEARVDTVVYGLEAPEHGGTRRCRPPDHPEWAMPRLVGGVQADVSRALLTRWLARHDQLDAAERFRTSG